MAGTGRTTYGGGAPSGGLRVPPGSEAGAPLARDTAVPLAAGESYTIVWTDDDDAGVPLAAGAIAYPDQKLTLNAGHTVLAVDEDGYYQWLFRLILTAGGSGADVRVVRPDGSFDHLHIAANAEETSRGLGIWPYPGGNIGGSITCLVGSVTVGYCILYAKRLSE